MDSELYPQAVQLIRANRSDLIPEPKHSPGDFQQYLILYQVKTKEGRLYYATFYDSDALEQDPQLIELIGMDV